MNRKILMSLGVLVFVVGLSITATGAFFNDTETSTGNTFTAGALDLKVDSEAHYNGLVCRLGVDNEANVGVLGWHADGTPFATDLLVPADHYPQPGLPCDGTWAETDLGITNKFFNLVDVKPGDEGEDTISLHVYNNDAWGRFLIRNVVDSDVSCTEPESEVGAEEPECAVVDVATTTPGELGETITFYAWLDQGAIAGFQGTTTTSDPTEGDNVWQCAAADSDDQDTVPEPNLFTPQMALGENCDEPLVILPGGISGPEDHNIWTALAGADVAYCSSPTFPASGHNSYGECHGIANDGRMVGSTTYYFGLAWNTSDVGNEAQTDSLDADLVFEVEQHRNNPTPFNP